MSKIRKIDDMMISVSDTKWNAKNNMTMINKLKPTNRSVIWNNSDSSEEFEEGRCVLKGGVFAAL